jgi:hypothetical protein
MTGFMSTTSGSERNSRRYRRTSGICGFSGVPILIGSTPVLGTELDTTPVYFRTFFEESDSFAFRELTLYYKVCVKPHSACG